MAGKLEQSPTESDESAGRLLKIAEVAAALRLSKAAVYELLNAGRLRYARLPGSGKRCTRRIRTSDLAEFVERSMVEVRSEPE